MKQSLSGYWWKPHSQERDGVMFGDGIIGREVVRPWQVPDCSKTAVQINSDFFKNTCESIVQ